MSGIATTDITGTLTNLMAQLMRHRDASKRSFQHGLLLGAVWIVYFGGAIAAAVGLPLNPFFALILPAAAVMCVVVTSAVAFRP